MYLPTRSRTREWSAIRLLALWVAWLPLAIGTVYLCVFAIHYPGLVRRVYWDSDAAMFAVAAQTAGRGSVVVLAHYGSYTSLWFAELTRWLPLHRQLWEVAPYGFSVLSVGLLGWAAWQLAGAWAAAMAVTIGVAASPVVNYDRVTMFIHDPASVAAVVLGTFCLWLSRSPPTRHVVAVAVLASVFAGMTLASDALFAVVGLLPFALTGVVFFYPLRMRLAGAVVVGGSILALPIAWLTERLTIGAKVVVWPPAPNGLAHLDELWSNLVRTLGLVGQVANGNYGGSGWTQPEIGLTSVLALVCTVLAIGALAAPFVLVRRALPAVNRSAPLVVWGSFWSVCVAGNVASDVFSQEGTHWGYYLLTVLDATAATVPVALATSNVRRGAAGIAISAVVAASLVNLVGPLGRFGGLPPTASVAARIVAVARADHAPYGYADYWDASSLTWSTKLAVSVSPVFFCVAETLCPFQYNDVSTWFQPHRTGSFVLEDSASGFLHSPPPSALGRPKAVVRLNREFTMYVYGYDIASRLDDIGRWEPVFSYGAGFDPPEIYQGAASRWMAEDGRLRITAGVATDVTIGVIAFSNRQPRRLELMDAHGDDLGAFTIPTYAVHVTFKPFVVPAGTTTLTVVATPGPQALGPSDPRSASVFLEPLTVTTGPTFAPAS